MLDVAAPLVEVTTYLDGDDELPSMEAEVARRERQDAAIRRQDWEEMAGDVMDDDEDVAASLETSSQDLEVLVNGEPRTVSAICYHHYQALQFRYDSLTIRAVSRHPLPEVPRFEIVTDLEPAFRGYTLFTLSLLKGIPKAKD